MSEQLLQQIIDLLTEIRDILKPPDVVFRFDGEVTPEEVARFRANWHAMRHIYGKAAS